MTNAEDPKQSSGDNINADVGGNTQNANIGKGNNQNIFTSYNQSGGITGIVNIGSQKRKISQEAANILATELRKYPAEEYKICAVFGDSEAYQLASIIEKILRFAGWKTEAVAHASLAGPPSAIIIRTPAEKLCLNFLYDWMIEAGLKPKMFLVPNSDKIRIIVGTNPD